MTDSKQTPGSLLRQRLQERAAANTATREESQGGPAPLSFAQERFWFVEKMFPGTSAFNRAHAVRLRGDLDVEALRRSFESIVARHAVLRASIRQAEDGPIQVARPLEAFTLTLVDLSHLDEAARPRALDDALMAAAARPFDLSRGPLLRAALWRLAEKDHVLLIGSHHIAADGWSDQILWRELDVGYRAHRRGKTAGLPPLLTQYADIARRERDPAREQSPQRALAYWRRQLQGLERPELPLARGRQPGPGAAGIMHVAVPPALTSRLRNLARASDVTLYMTMLAGFQALLARYLCSDDLAVGTAVNGRDEAAKEALIGMFVNTLVMRADLADDPTFAQLLRRTRTTALAAYQHQHIAFDKLVRELQPQRDPLRNPLFDVFFQLTGFDRAVQKLEGLDIEALPEISVAVDLDLDFTFRDAGQHLPGKIVFNRDLYDEAQIAAMFKQYLTLLRAAVRDPHTPVSALPVLVPEERQRVLAGWNETAKVWPEAGQLPRLVEAQVRRSPTAPAVVAPDGATLTFGQLNRRANRLARYLRLQGLQRGQIVGLVLERSAELMVALLAVLKSGAVYLPLDPTYPRQRLATMLADARPEFLLLRGPETAGAGAWGEGTATLIDLEAAAGAIDAGDASDLSSSPAAEDIAYVIYTSGSTGVPKGVGVPHQALRNFSLAARDFLELGPDDRVWQFATINFDTAIEEIYPAWIAGAAVVLREAAIPPVSRLAGLITTLGLTVLDLPTAYWQEWLRHLEREASGPPPPLRAVMVGGEKVEADAWQRWQSLPGARDVALLNSYGATELTAISTLYRAGTEPLPGAVPIGRPVANVQAYVLNKALQPQPPGAPGELYIGGAGLAAGYLKDQALTDERFLPNPFVGETPGASARIYRTGDLAAYDPAGLIYYRGRADQQIKLRGYRMEPAEIEMRLRAREDIDEAVVVLHQDQRGEKALAAYVVAAPGQAPNMAEMRDQLAAGLPPFMVPASFTLLPKLPLNPHGKIDRSALPPPALEPIAARVEAIPARSEQELALLSLWREVLARDDIGVHDDFFAAGGHSLLGVRLFALIESRLGHRLPLNLLFQAPTVAEMAAALRVDEGENGGATVLVTVRPGSGRPALYAPHGLYGDNLAFNNVLRHLPDDQPFYGFQAVGLLPGHDPDQSIEAMAARYVAAMREHQPFGPYYLAGYCFGGHIAYEMACQIEAAGEHVALLALVDSTAALTYHAPVPLYDRRRLQAIRAAAPHWLAGYGEFGGWRLPDRLRTVMEQEQQTQITGMETLLITGEHGDFADIAADRPPVHYEMRAHHARLRPAYQPRPYGGEIVLIRPEADRMGRLLLRPFDPLRGWGTLAAGVDVHFVGGSHATILHGQNAAGIAAVLRRYLPEGESGWTGPPSVS